MIDAINLRWNFGGSIMNTARTKLDTRSVALCGLFAALTAAGAFIKIPLPLIPLTLQCFFVTLGGLLLGAKRGAIAQIVYMVIGLIGIPIFTRGGGPQYVLEPTFGYILSFSLGAYVTGALYARMKEKTFFNALFSALAGIAVIYAIGVLYMYLIVTLYIGKEMTPWAAIWTGAVVCAPGDIITSILAAAIAVRMKGVVGAPV
jgi:biotin transport system substrate-specific component